ncbi:hypothetical protein L9G15_18100 [Shewanella sp. A3A]|nr:hypothetical protein [Shewanella ferrihydritica]
MFVAINKGKARRVNVNGLDVSWRALYQRSEDLVTAVVWSRLAYLSPNTLQTLLSKLCPEIDSALGELQDIELWPYWSVATKSGASTANDTVQKYEPDVVLHFADWILIVEAKRVNEDNYQDATQWQNYLQSAQTLYPNKRQALLAVGGLGERPSEFVQTLIEQQPDSFRDIPINGVSWQQFYQLISEFAEYSHAGERILLRDLCDAMRANGVTAYRDFHSLLDWRALSPSFSLQAEKTIREFSQWDK